MHQKHFVVCSHLHCTRCLKCL